VISRIKAKYHAEGFKGLRKALMRRLISVVHPVDMALQEISRDNGFAIVQIGAYVGNDENVPLYYTLRKRMCLKRGSLIVVEPVKEIFDTLVESYRGVPGVSFENVAISNRSGPAKFYRLGVDPVEHGYPAWLSQLGSLKEERMGLLWDRYEANDDYKAFYLKHRIEETVDCITFSELLHRHGLCDVDLLQMDVEGSEFEILSTVDFAGISVRFVNYECVLLHNHKRETETLMKSNGYHVLDYGQDSFCYKDPDKHLIERWRRRAAMCGAI
jgi:FkbM family methyltransferase